MSTSCFRSNNKRRTVLHAFRHDLYLRRMTGFTLYDDTGTKYMVRSIPYYRHYLVLVPGEVPRQVVPVPVVQVPLPCTVCSTVPYFLIISCRQVKDQLTFSYR